MNLQDYPLPSTYHEQDQSRVCARKVSGDVLRRRGYENVIVVLHRRYVASAEWSVTYSVYTDESQLAAAEDYDPHWATLTNARTSDFRSDDNVRSAVEHWLHSL